MIDVFHDRCQDPIPDPQSAPSFALLAQLIRSSKLKLNDHTYHSFNSCFSQAKKSCRFLKRPVLSHLNWRAESKKKKSFEKELLD